MLVKLYRCRRLVLNLFFFIYIFFFFYKYINNLKNFWISLITIFFFLLNNIVVGDRLLMTIVIFFIHIFNNKLHGTYYYNQSFPTIDSTNSQTKSNMRPELPGRIRRTLVPPWTSPQNSSSCRTLLGKQIVVGLV